mgnify:CR=1 FL=1
MDTQVRSGPGLHYPVLANIGKGTKLNVVEEDKGWLKVESKRGNEARLCGSQFSQTRRRTVKQGWQFFWLAKRLRGNLSSE